MLPLNRIIRYLILILLLFTVSTVAAELPKRGACSHRGVNSTFPENTIPAFAEAVRLGARQIEFDICLTKDDRMVIMHDLTVDRTTDGKGKVRDLTFDEIRSLDAGVKKDAKFKGTKVPTLEEVLDAIPAGIWINIHLKESRAAVAVTKVLVEKKRTDQAFLACSRKSALAAKEVCPNVKICNMERQGGDVSRYIRETIEWKCEFIQLAGKLGTPDEMKQLRDAGVRINYFPAKSPQQFKELVAAGVDFPLVDDLPAYLDLVR